MFEVVDLPVKGFALVATDNILPGQILLEETALLSASDQTVKSSKCVKLFELTGIPGVVFALYSEFLKLSHEKQQKVLGLYGPTTGLKAHALRSNALNYARQNSWTDRDVDSFVKVAMVYVFNCFGGDGSSRVIFETSSRMIHSCQPNCTLNRFDNKSEVRAILPILKGDELTISYNAVFNDKPTHQRRENYETFKDFTCQCPRCAAQGDDTRQFACFDKTCAGRHYACQPTSDIVPYLLPCIECHQSSPKEYANEMLALEKQLPQQLQIVESQYDKLVHSRGIEIGRGALESVSYHRQSLGISEVICRVMRQRGDKERLLEACKTAMRVFDHSLLFPNVATADAYYRHSGYFLFADCSEGLDLAQTYCQQAVQMQLVLNGREKRDADYDTLLANILSKQQIKLRHWTAKSPDLSVCSFCGEGPLRAKLTLRTCSKCKQVVYCSKGCQKAHWKIHKENCVK